MQEIEKLENLPNKEKIRKSDWNWDRDYYYRSDYPYKRVDRFLLSRVGLSWDDVVSEYVKLDWIPPQYRNSHFLAMHELEVNTFTHNENIFFYDRCSFNGKSQINIKEYHSDLFYVHPETKLLCFQAKSKNINWKARHEAEEAKTMRVLGDYWQLLKLGGIWYEIKAQIYKGAYAELSNKYLPNERLIGGEINYHWSRKNELAKPVKIILKRQLSSKELKKHGLGNDIVHSKVKCKTCGGFNCLITHK